MVMNAPPKISRRRFAHGGGDRREVGSHVALETMLADVAEQFLQPVNPQHARAAECFERILGKLAFAHVAANGAVAIVSRESGETHRPCFHPSLAGAIGVLFTHRSGNDLLEIIREEVLGRLLQWKQTALSG
jgi:hypothetical protein